MQRSSYRLAVVCVAAGVLASALPAIAQQKGSPLIVPGKSVGEISLDMKQSEVHRKLGEPATDDAAMAGRRWEGWFAPKEGGGRGAELDIYYLRADENAKESSARAIRVESPFFHTKEGVGTKSSLADIWKAFPNLRYVDRDLGEKAVETYFDAPHGIAIEVRRTSIDTGASSPPGAWGVCQAIIVCDPDDDPEQGLPPIQSMR